MEIISPSLTFIQQIFDHQPEATVLVHSVLEKGIQNNAAKIVDFRFSYCNTAIEELTGMKKDDLIGKRVLADRLPDPGISEDIFQQCLEVYQTGKPMEYSYFSTVLEKFVTLHRVKIDDGVLTTARNRTEEYKIQIEKERQAKLLQSVVEHSPYGISLYESIRNDKGEIIDFKLKLLNKKSAELTALSVQQLQTHTVKELIALRGTSNFFRVMR